MFFAALFFTVFFPVLNCSRGLNLEFIEYWWMGIKLLQKIFPIRKMYKVTHTANICNKFVICRTIALVTWCIVTWAVYRRFFQNLTNIISLKKDGFESSVKLELQKNGLYEFTELHQASEMNAKLNVNLPSLLFLSHWTYAQNWLRSHGHWNNKSNQPIANIFELRRETRTNIYSICDYHSIKRECNLCILSHCARSQNIDQKYSTNIQYIYTLAFHSFVTIFFLHLACESARAPKRNRCNFLCFSFETPKPNRWRLLFLFLFTLIEAYSIRYRIYYKWTRE